MRLKIKKLKRVLRILLMTVILLITSFPLVMISKDLIAYQSKSNYEVFGILLFPSLFGFGNLFFHMSYLNRLKSNNYRENKRSIKLVFWISNVLVSLSILGFVSFVFYELYSRTETIKEIELFITIFSSVSIIGIINLVDVFFVKRNLDQLKRNRIIEIDKIGQEF